MKKIVEVNHVSKTYGRLNNKTEVLDNISFTVDEGEFVGIMGPSGAGKSTLLNVLSSIILPTAGIVRIAGQDILKMRDNQLSDFRRNEMGFIFQSFNLIDTLNVKDNILLPLAVEKVSLEEMDKRLLHVTSILGIQELLSDYPPEISVGQKQRVAAARALITNPKIIFADEPTGSLDSKSATELLKYLAEINLHDDATILMVTHDPYTASFCNRILFIKDGAIFSEVVRQGSRKEFFNRVIDMQATIGGGGRANDF
ncbi:ABC transporter ATP-binding protein [Enterococcus faecalis]|uniref:ABC transporter ATP-binding protein n=1 Tax=Enterococcus TaxID=1350 RepID=UPI00027C6EBB|nr:ABC transporter ATP-binding protein [Enterococcus faecalis]EGO5024849.1 ABC transporter ATP-binding protein [Enterococcus faecalis]EGO7784937.1 ABC transporter ATP-binding protein [Enterococcus faecalis]EGO8057705.1 ABC transporter ATP-binding protein [Enterococcus faecalis]EGO8059615.1 ABC transporter ATP-binding protein [Enterococcus faecalis]EGO8144386.1 ABC transporter ATP-binding protein [Enterococcus faecalis]